MPRPKRKARVLLVDDHPIVRQGLALLIGQEPDLRVCGEASSPREALAAAVKLKPDIAIVDLSLQEESGLELVKSLRSRHRKLPILVLSMHEETIYAQRALRSGASGYVMKQQATDDVVLAIRKVLAGEVHLSPQAAARVLRRVAGGQGAATPEDVLSDRELEVFRWIGRGYGNRQIAETLGRSVKTVETYRENIKRKLGLADSSELVRYAVDWERARRAA